MKLVAHHDLNLYHMDMETNFLNENLDEKI